MKKSFLLVIVLSAILSSCGGGSTTESKLGYLPFKSSENGKWGMIGLDGKILFEEEFKNEPTAVFNDRFFYCNDNGEIEFFKADENATQIEGSFKDIAPFFYDDVTVAVRKNERISIIDKDGNTIATLESAGGNNILKASSFSCGLSIIRTKEGYGCVNRKGEVVVNPKYSILTPFFEDVALAADDNNTFFVINTAGEVLFSFANDKYCDMSPYFKHGYSAVAVNDGDERKWGFMNKKGEIVLKPSAKNVRITDWTDKTFIFSDGSMFGLKNFDNEVILRAKYDGLRYATENGKYLWAYESSKRAYTLINESGDEISKESYRDVNLFYNGSESMVRMSDHEWGLISTKGNDVKIKADIYILGGQLTNYSDWNSTRYTMSVLSDFVNIGSIITSADIKKNSLGAYSLDMKSEQIAIAWWKASGSVGERPIPNNCRKANLSYNQTVEGVEITTNFYYSGYLTTYNHITQQYEWTNESPIYIEQRISGYKLSGKEDLIFSQVASIIKGFGSVLEEGEDCLIVNVGQGKKYILSRVYNGITLKIKRTVDIEEVVEVVEEVIEIP